MSDLFNNENISDALKRNAPMAPGPTLVPVKRYTSRVYHELEKTHLWKKSWQMACHEDDFKNVGDAVPYDITTMSFLIVKVSEGEYKAYSVSYTHLRAHETPEHLVCRLLLEKKKKKKKEKKKKKKEKKKKKKKRKKKKKKQENEQQVSKQNKTHNKDESQTQKEK